MHDHYFFFMMQNYTMSSNSKPSSDQQNNQDDNASLWSFVTREAKLGKRGGGGGGCEMLLFNAIFVDKYTKGHIIESRLTY